MMKKREKKQWKMIKKREKIMNNYEKERKKQRTMMNKREKPLKMIKN
jgi:hypothetical protein